MSKKLVLEVHTIEKTIVHEEVDSVTVPTAEEELTVLFGHTPLVSSLGDGTLTYHNQEGDQFLFISGGFMEIQNQRVIILADLIQRPEEIDEKEIAKAKKEAQDIISGEKAIEGRNLASAMADMNIATRRVKFLERYKHRSK
ncbi:ATP synthase F1 subunit epsilon, partial [Patescibacteria group bacterium]|nr:ATP synthase F1 subunit epsilon [Patescibacteria group bacterium]